MNAADRFLSPRSVQELVDKRRTMMEEYRTYREAAAKKYQEQRPLRLELRGGAFTGNDVPKFPLVSFYFYILRAVGKIDTEHAREVLTSFLAHPRHFHRLYLTIVFLLETGTL